MPLLVPVSHAPGAPVLAGSHSHHSLPEPALLIRNPNNQSFDQSHEDHRRTTTLSKAINCYGIGRLTGPLVLVVCFATFVAAHPFARPVFPTTALPLLGQRVMRSVRAECRILLFLMTLMPDLLAGFWLPPYQFLPAACYFVIASATDLFAPAVAAGLAPVCRRAARPQVAIHQTAKCHRQQAPCAA